MNDYTYQVTLWNAENLHGTWTIPLKSLNLAINCYDHRVSVATHWPEKDKFLTKWIAFVLISLQLEYFLKSSQKGRPGALNRFYKIPRFFPWIYDQIVGVYIHPVCSLISELCYFDLLLCHLKHNTVWESLTYSLYNLVNWIPADQPKSKVSKKTLILLKKTIPKHHVIEETRMWCNYEPHPL